MYNGFSERDVVIPEGVEQIATAAFFAHAELETVLFPSSLRVIGKFSFAECSSLKEIVIRSNVVDIAADAFDGCQSLRAIQVDSQNECFCSEDGVLYSSDRKVLLRVPPGTPLARYSIPDSVVEIGVNAFNRVKGMKLSGFPSGVKVIGDKAFCYFDGLDEAVLGKQLGKIGYCAFSNCIRLSNIRVDEGNPFFRSSGGVLYSGDGSVLIQRPYAMPNEEFMIPEHVTDVRDRALSGSCLRAIHSESPAFSEIDGVLFQNGYRCLLSFPSQKAVAEYVVPDSVNTLHGSSFQGCAHIDTVVLGPATTKISRHSFESSSLREIKASPALEHIGWFSFSRCHRIVSVNLSETKVNYINGGAFSFCSDLSRIDFPDTIRKIVRWAFVGCPRLKTVSFHGKADRMFFDGAQFSVPEEELNRLY